MEMTVYLEKWSRKDMHKNNLCSQKPNYAMYIERVHRFGGEVRMHLENEFWKENIVYLVREEERYPTERENLMWKWVVQRSQLLWNTLLVTIAMNLGMGK